MNAQKVAIVLHKLVTQPRIEAGGTTTWYRTKCVVDQLAKCESACRTTGGTGEVLCERGEDVA